jgi:ammonia channel protein AmtB
MIRSTLSVFTVSEVLGARHRCVCIEGNQCGWSGRFDLGNVGLLKAQFIAVGATIAFAAVGTAVILFVIKAAMGLRVTEDEERLGLDLSQHSESAYSLTQDFDENVVRGHGH